MRRSAEAEKAHALALLYCGDAKGSKADDPGAEEGRGVERVKLGGNWKTKVCPSQRVFSVASVYRVAGESGEIAEIFFISAAVGAGAVGAPDPGHAYSCARRQSVSCNNGANDLVPRNHSRVPWRKFAFNNM
jgi:hypothetical protein